MRKTLTAPQALLLLAALLTPIFGGYVASDATKIGPDGLLSAMAEGQAPIFQHALLALPVFAAMVLLLLGRRVQQIPNPNVAAALVLLVGSLGPAVALSAYRGVAVNVWMEWVAYAVALLAVVSGMGRRVGPVALLAAVALGTAWVGRAGVMEYLATRREIPNWRVFCGWSNPNAAAGMLVLGFVCALGLPRARERATNLLVTLGVVVGGGMVLCALLLTGSKGGTLLALPTGLVTLGLVGGRRHPALYPLAVLVLALSAVAFLKSIPSLGVGAALLFAVGTLAAHRLHVGRMLGAFAFGGLMLAFFASTTPPQLGGVTGASRLAAASETNDQSAVFRINLWKSAATLAKERPAFGWGLGAYRYESARPGLVTSTVFAHNTYLQLAAEAGLMPLLLLLGLLGLWARRVLRGSSRLPEEGRLAFAAALGGAAAVLAHALVDSDLSYFGLGLSFFLVLGAASLLAADAVAPEFIPRNSRFLAAAGVAALGGLFLWLGSADDAKSEVRGGVREPDSLERLAGWDGDAAYLWAVAQPDAEPALKHAYDLLPTPKVARRLAEIQAAKGELASAEDTLRQVLPHDPTNLKTLYLLMRVQGLANEPQDAAETARRLVAVEERPVFKIRALDQLVPTETDLARIQVLANAETDPRRRAEILATAVRGMVPYAQITVPAILRFAKNDPNADFAGERLRNPEGVQTLGSPSAAEKMALGTSAARTAADLFRKLGDAKSAEEMEADAAILSKAIPE